MLHMKNSKKGFDFSIDALLRREKSWGDVRSSENHTCEIGDSVNLEKHKMCGPHSHDEVHLSTDELLQISGPVHFSGGSDDNKQGIESTFSWLSCTRFKPPKLPHSRRKSVSRRHGRGPRIPFSSHQLAVLESAFVRSQYLSSDAITRLADSLQLTEIRVKIWFQNRRARFRREQNSYSGNVTCKVPLPTTLTHSPGFNFHTDLDCSYSEDGNGISELVPQIPAIQSSKFMASSSDGQEKDSLSMPSKQQQFRHLINDLNLIVAAGCKK